MQQLLQHGMQWAPITGLVICFGLFIAVLWYQLVDRRPHYQDHMRSLPLDDGSDKEEA